MRSARSNGFSLPPPRQLDDVHSGSGFGANLPEQAHSYGIQNLTGNQGIVNYWVCKINRYLRQAMGRKRSMTP